MDFTSRQLRAFLLVAQYSSFSRAAAALFITPSALSVLIRGLETHLGFRLFDRTTRHVVLTAFGSELLSVVQRNLAELDAAMLRIEKSAVGIRSSLSLGATPLISANVLPQAIKEFRGYRPDLQIRLFDGTTAAIVERIEAGELDVGLGVFPRTAFPVVRTPFFRFSLMLIRSAKDPVLRRASTTWSALRGERLIALHPANPMQQLIDKHLAKARVVAHSSISINLLDTQIAMVEADEGVAIIPSFGLLACRNRKVVMSRLINPVVNMDFHQIRKRGRQLSASADEFSYFLKNYIARWAGCAGIT
jgi:LysR family carnitine catabolism transcriptional activator